MGRAQESSLICGGDARSWTGELRLLLSSAAPPLCLCPHGREAGPASGCAVRYGPNPAPGPAFTLDEISLLSIGRAAD